eukprot:scaffold128228_cov60-Phaeocystis_antarctica.AAC.2
MAKHHVRNKSRALEGATRRELKRAQVASPRCVLQLELERRARHLVHLDEAELLRAGRVAEREGRWAVVVVEQAGG